MKKINLGNIDKFILFGGGRLLLYIVKKLMKVNYQAFVFSARRHLNEDIDGKSFSRLLEEANIPYFESKDINNDAKAIKEISEKTIGFSLGATWIFNKGFIRSFNGRLLNMHGMKLPQNRGGGGFTWQILRRDRLGCCLIHQIDSGIDTGDIIKQKEFIYPTLCKVPKDYMDYSYRQNIVFFDEFLADVKNKKDFTCIAQQERMSCYWPRLNTYKQAFINWNWRLKDIESFINAFDEPYCGASTFIKDKRVFLKDCYADYNEGPFHPFQTGIVYRIGEGTLFTAANEGVLVVKKAFDEAGQNIIDKIKLGDRFFTSVKYLESARSFRAIYTPNGLKDEQRKSHESLLKNVK